MTPRKRLAWASAALAGVLAVLAYVVIGVLSGAGLSSWHRNAGASLSIAPAAAMAAGLASWWITAWWENVDRRSEEHTSELQSLMRISYAVFCLKKKIQQINEA